MCFRNWGEKLRSEDKKAPLVSQPYFVYAIYFIDFVANMQVVESVI